MNAHARGLLLAFALATSACGYTFGSGLPEKGVRTIALTVVGNETYRQRLEVELTAALSRELPVSSDLRLQTTSRADAVLQVVIEQVEDGVLVTGGRPQPVKEGILSAAVRMRLVAHDGRILIDRPLLDRTEFRSSIGEDLTTARAELVNDLARKIALALETDF